MPPPPATGEHGATNQEEGHPTSGEDALFAIHPQQPTQEDCAGDAGRWNLQDKGPSARSGLAGREEEGIDWEEFGNDEPDEQRVKERHGTLLITLDFVKEQLLICDAINPTITNLG